MYNTTLYTIKKHFERNNHYLSLKELFHALKNHPNYRALSSDHAQLTMRKVRQNFSSFFAKLTLHFLILPIYALEDRFQVFLFWLYFQQ